MVTIKCRPPCPYDLSCSPFGDHYHHWHDVEDPDCIIEHAKHCGIITSFRFSQTEYKQLRSKAQTMRLGQTIICDLDHNFKEAHYCPYERTKLGIMNSIAGMCWSISIKNYAEVAEIIQRIYDRYGPDSIRVESV